MGGPAGLSFLSCSKNLSPPDSVTPEHLGRAGLTTFYILLHKPYHTARRVEFTSSRAHRHTPNVLPRPRGRRPDHSHLVYVCPPWDGWRWKSGSYFPQDMTEAQGGEVCFLEKQNFWKEWKTKESGVKCTSHHPAPPKEPGKTAHPGERQGSGTIPLRGCRLGCREHTVLWQPRGGGGKFNSRQKTERARSLVHRPLPDPPRGKHVCVGGGA